MCMQQHVSTHLPVAVFWVAVQFVCNRCDKTHTHFELWSGTDAGALGLKGSCHVRWRLLEGSELVAGSARVEEKSERWDFLLQVNAQSRQCRVHLPPQSGLRSRVLTERHHSGHF